MHRDRWGWSLIAALVLGSALSLVHATRADEAAPKNPHGSFKGECSLCHDPKAWKPARIGKDFDHGKFSFPLTGAHAAAGCRACHESLEFSRAAAVCASCHQDVHSGELGVDCARCHTSRSFIDRIGMVRAHQATRFPLIGAHAAIDCDACHRPEPTGHMRYVGLQVECESCHLKDYQATTNPNHASVGFTTDCRVCHTMMTWSSARFDHRTTRFPLTGAHVGLPCERCHVGGVFTGLDPACVSCHQADYDATNPSHSSLGFPTTCETCHNTSNWNATFKQHDSLYFPIYSGTHAGRWSSCTQCHTDTANYLVFTCLSCHPHDSKTQTDSNHSGVSGYQYDSQACYSCHRNGRAG